MTGMAYVMSGNLARLVASQDVNAWAWIGDGFGEDAQIGMALSGMQLKRVDDRRFHDAVNTYNPGLMSTVTSQSVVIHHVKTAAEMQALFARFYPSSLDPMPADVEHSCNNSVFFTVSHLEQLYARYAEDGLREARAMAERFCEFPKQQGFPHAHRCQYSIVEMELLYLFLRDGLAGSDGDVLELCSAVGYTTMWMLAAIVHGKKKQHVWGMDVFDTSAAMPPPSIVPLRFLQQWHFEQGNVDSQSVARLMQNTSFGYIVMDADHSRAFAEWYTKSVLDPAMEKVAGGNLLIAVHDIWDDARNYEIKTDEGDVILDWLRGKGKSANTKKHSCMLLGDRFNPAMQDAVQLIREKVLGHHEATKIIGRNNRPCTLFFLLHGEA